MTNASRWYVVQTRPHAEVKASAHLARQGFKTFLPRYLKRRRHARKIDIVPAPLFPSYLFVAIDMQSQRWRSIRSTLGVSHLVCHGDDPAVVADDVIAGIRRRADVRGFIQLDSVAAFRPGEKVRVLDGAFLDCLGLFEGMSDNDRIAVLLELLGRKVRVVMDAYSIEAA